MSLITKKKLLSEVYMDNKKASAHQAQVEPSAKKNRVSIYSPWTDRMTSVDPYGRTAKRLYRFYINELGYDVSWIVPADLKFYEQSGSFRRLKPAQMPQPKLPPVKLLPAYDTKKAYKGFLSASRVHNVEKLMGYAGFELFRKLKPLLDEALAQHGGVKAHCASACFFDRVIEGAVYDEGSLQHSEFPNVQITNASQVDSALKAMINQMKEDIPEVEMRGTGWKFTRVSFLDIHIAKYKPLKGASYLPLPEQLAAKKAIVNVRNTDDQCFKWSVLSALHPVTKNPQRQCKYEEHEHKLDWSGLGATPGRCDAGGVTLDKIPLFEKRNRVSINVYGCDITKKLGQQTNDEWLLSKSKCATTKEEREALLERRNSEATHPCKPFLIQKSQFGAEAQVSVEARAKYSDEEWDILGAEPLQPKIWRHVDLLLFEGPSPDGQSDETRSHYCWIKSFSRFARQKSDLGNASRHFCNYCLHGFATAEKLKQHLGCGCREITETRPVLPVPGTPEAFVEFKSPEKQHKAPFVIIADFEALTEPVSKASRNPTESYTDAYQTHTASGLSIYTLSADPSKTFTPIRYRGDNLNNTVKKFVFEMNKLEEELVPLVKAVEPMLMTADNEREFQCAVDCCFCKKALGSDRVRDHDHLTGAYRGAAHNSCNLEEGKKRTRHYTIPVFFHNLKGYDSHLIMGEIGKYTAKLSAIPMNFEKMISFSYSHLRFLDSHAFLSASLDTLVKNLYEGGKGKHKFIHSARHCPKPEHLDLLLKKGVYPYDYMNAWSRFDEDKLPPKKEFYSKLSGSHISDDDYEHAHRVWRAFGCKTLGDYHDLYVETDVLLLADVFESFREMCLDYYELVGRDAQDDGRQAGAPHRLRSVSDVRAGLAGRSRDDFAQARRGKQPRDGRRGTKATIERAVIQQAQFHNR